MAEIAYEHVSKIYPDGTQAVHDLDLEIQDGELMVLVGPSGCGKTTALRMLAGLEEISEGEIRIGDRIVNDLTPKDRDIAMVFQSYALYPHMTVAAEPRLRPQAAQAAEEGGQRARAAGGEDSPDRGVPEAQAAGALRRPAAARGDGPRDRARAAGVPDGRAALEPRCEAARADAGRDPPAPAAARRDHDLRHARPGRGDDDGRPRRRHERRSPTAGRHAAGALRPARSTSSWPASSARRRSTWSSPSSPGATATSRSASASTS